MFMPGEKCKNGSWMFSVKMRVYGVSVFMPSGAQNARMGVLCGSFTPSDGGKRLASDAQGHARFNLYIEADS